MTEPSASGPHRKLFHLTYIVWRRNMRFTKLTEAEQAERRQMSGLPVAGNPLLWQGHPDETMSRLRMPSDVCRTATR